MAGDGGNTADVGEGGEVALSRVLVGEAVGPVGAGDDVHGAALLIVARVVGDCGMFVSGIWR